MKNKNKNGFLITWISSIVVLLVCCFFGMSDSIKGTRAALTCPSGYPNLSGNRCYKEVNAKSSTKYSATGSCSCKGDTSTASGSCSCTNSGGQYKGGTCTSSGGCSCPSGYPTVSSNYCKTTPNTWSGTCDASDDGKASCLCGGGSVTSNSCGVSSSIKYSCSEGTLVGNKCRIYVDAIEEKPADSSPNPSSSSNPSCITKHPGIDYTCSYYYSGSTMCYDCTKKGVNDANYNANSEEEALTKCKNDNGKDCDCTYLAENVGGTGAYYCRPKNVIGDNPVSGAKYQCYKDTSTGKYIYGAFTGSNYYAVDDKYCGFSAGDAASACLNRTAIDDRQWGYLSPPSGKSCSYYYFGDDNSVCWYNCKTNMCAEGTHATTDEFGNVVCAPDCTCEETGCSEDEKKENSYCWLCNGSYSWGLESDNNGCKLTYISSENSCKGSYSPTPIPKPSSPSSSNPVSSNPSSSNPSSSKPTDTDDSDDRGDGCYKNKDTGEFKWFDNDPELNSNTDNYEKVNDSNCKHNVTENPQTGEIAMFFIWIIAFCAVGYSVWYYVKSRKES